MRLTSRSWLGVLILAAASVAGAQAGRGGNMPASLRAAIAHGPGLAYSGTRTVEFRVGASLQRHIELVRRKGDLTRIEFPKGSEYEGQIIVEDAEQRRQYLPDTNEILLLPARREEAFDRLKAMMGAIRSGQVRVSASPGGLVAGFRTEMVAVSDLDGNPLQRLWIEPNSGMILKREMFDRVGTRVGFFEFRNAELNPRFRPEEFQIQRRGADEVSPEMQLRRLARSSGLPVKLIPAGQGFRLESVRLQRLAAQSVLVQAYVGRNGRLSLFTLKGAVDRQQIRRLAQGDFNVHVWSEEGATFALVGELSPVQLAALARRTNPSDSPDVY